MRSLPEVRYSNGLAPDHLPEMAGDGRERRAALAYAMAYLRVLLERANAEVV